MGCHDNVSGTECRPAGFYAWLHNPVCARDKDNQRLLTLIRDSYALSGGVYGCSTSPEYAAIATTW